MSPPPNAWYKREGNKAVIGCENNDKEWTVTCTGNRWQGEIGNCTTSGTYSKLDTFVAFVTVRVIVILLLLLLLFV
jgi:hypothetical protein